MFVFDTHLLSNTTHTILSAWIKCVWLKFIFISICLQNVESPSMEMQVSTATAGAQSSWGSLDQPDISHHLLPCSTMSQSSDCQVGC